MQIGGQTDTNQCRTQTVSQCQTQTDANRCRTQIVRCQTQIVNQCPPQTDANRWTDWHKSVSDTDSKSVSDTDRCKSVSDTDSKSVSATLQCKSVSDTDWCKSLPREDRTNLLVIWYKGLNTRHYIPTGGWWTSFQQKSLFLFLIKIETQRWYLEFNCLCLDSSHMSHHVEIDTEHRPSDAARH